MEKDDYNTAITAWVIVLIILIVILVVIGYLTYKGRKQLGGTVDEVSKLEKSLEKKREEVVALLAKQSNRQTPLYG